jgi:hypothetical protein
MEAPESQADLNNLKAYWLGSPEMNYRLVKIKFRVKVLDIKRQFGKVRYLITPTKGKGQFWATEDYMKFVPKNT